MKRNEGIPYLESDPKIFEDRFARCRRLLHFLATRILGSEDEAGDAVRNCRAAASRNPPSFESEGAFRSWLARILIDEACALLRRKQFSLMRSPKSLFANPEGSRVCPLYGDNDAYTLGISDRCMRTR
jgi:DNA-directed RNA polymerase specialized sigma24 family protein